MSDSKRNPKTKETAKFREKRDKIIDAAIRQINQNGVTGMTIVEVAKAVNLTTASVTYYFKKKEMLAKASFLYSLGVIEQMIQSAAEEEDARTRVGSFIRKNLELRAAIRLGQARPLTLRPDIRALDEEGVRDIQEAYQRLSSEIKGFFDEDPEFAASSLNSIRAHILMENIFWLPAWIARYSVSDFERINDRLYDVLKNGIGNTSSDWEPDIISLPVQDETKLTKTERAREKFLKTATRLINERGYHGASVDRIAAELNVTKGSFYHHIETKDELVMECFRRSYGHVSETQKESLDRDGTYWHKLSSCLATLINDQFYGEFQLLRTTAILALPTTMRIQVVERSNRMARRFAGMISDCIIDQSSRPIDPLVASQVIMSMVNGGYELRGWAAKLPPEQAVRDYTSTIVRGLFSEPPAN